jgi:uncharacterized SAM-binding protein YcdF (DUF218 family)
MVSRVDRGAVANWWWTVDRWFFAAFLLLMGLGVVLSFAASPAVAERIGLGSYHFVTRQMMFMLLAVGVMIAISFLDTRQIRRLALVMLAGSLVLMVAALYFGVEIKGARRWIHIAGVSVQPSEYLKPAFVVICAWLFSEQTRQSDIPGNLFAMILLGLVLALLAAQPDLGQTLLVLATWGVMFFMAGMPWFWIVVLGGGFEGAINLARGGYELNASGDRFVEAAILARRYPDARLIISGGSGSVFIEGEADADTAPRLLMALGVPQERILLENKSRDTFENARFSREIADLQPGETWLLVTSAFHMPRSVGAFRQAGFQVVPWPVDYKTTGRERPGPTEDNVLDSLRNTTAAIREWIGLIAYRVTGRTDSLLPALDGP